MVIPFTASLLDSLDDGPELLPLAGRVRRLELGDGAWLDLAPGWATASDALFERLVTDVPWQADRRTMYDRVVEVPRLVSSYGVGDALPDPVLAAARDDLNEHYARRGAPDEQLFRVGSGLGRDTMVGILSLGAPRTLAVRSRRTGRVDRFPLGHGDLLVMGGSCQRTHEHAIAKTKKAVGPRISVQFRPRWDEGVAGRGTQTGAAPRA